MMMIGPLPVIFRDGHQGSSVVVALRPTVTPFKRFHTLGASRRRFAAQLLSKRPASTIELADLDNNNQKCDQNGGGQVPGGEKGGGSDGPASWSTSFEKLLDDPVGLHTFAEFLKKEFSAENIYFWTACERYRKLGTQQERCLQAQRIFKQHLGQGAAEAVNVDAQGVQAAEQGLADAGPDLFDTAQKQIFNLIKFDSYPRFLKSPLYKKCLAGEVYAPTFDSRLALHNTASHLSLTTPSKLKKSLSNAEDRRRKSLLPWHRKGAQQHRSKSRDRTEGTNTQKSWDGVLSSHHRLASTSDIHSSHSSLTSLDLAASQDNLRHEDQLRTALCRVLLTNGSTTVVQIKEEYTIQQFINRLLEKRGLSYSSYEVFTNKHPKAVDVTESSSKLAGCEVTVEQRVVFKLDLPNKKIISVKSKYTKLIVDVLRPILHRYKFALEEVVVTRAGYSVDVNLPVTTIDNARLNIQLKDEEVVNNSVIKVNNNKLEEITNKVFEGILKDKSDGATTLTANKSDKGSVKSEDWGSEHSSGLLSKFLRRDSAINDKKKKSVACPARLKHLPADETDQKKPLIAKLKAGANKLHVGASSESDELVEGLTRAQRRLEDQRGTEINFELPDFLKDKDDTRTSSLQRQTSPNYENQHVTVSPTRKESATKLEPKVASPAKGGARMDPPPLPPKPKIVPIKPPNWGQGGGFYKAKEVPVDKRTKEMFLEQPSSSFV